MNRDRPTSETSFGPFVWNGVRIAQFIMREFAPIFSSVEIPNRDNRPPITQIGTIPRHGPLPNRAARRAARHGRRSV